MAGSTSKTSVKSTVTHKNAAVKTSKATKTAAKATAAKSAPEKKSAVKKTTKPAEAKSKSAAAKPVVKPASKPTTASSVKTKATSKPETSKKAVVKKTVKSEKAPKPVEADAVKKTSKPAKPAQAETPVKTTQKTSPAKTTSTKTPKVSKAKSAETVSKPAVVKDAIKKPEAPVIEPESEAKPKAKRATKFMTKANAAIIAQLRQQLLQRRSEILSSFWGGLDTANVSSQASGDTADAAIDSVHSEMRSQLAEKESQELTSIDNALHKMETGEYGLCEECGMPIPVERLEVIPGAELCLKCQEELEEDGDYDNYSYYGFD